MRKLTRPVLRGGNGGNAISLTRPWKRRLRYGTLICDLERSVPIDVLPDRSVETVAQWLAAHPTVELVSRDGSKEYASAITKGAPQARQVSDRWHLTKNLALCASVALTQCLAELRRGSRQVERLSAQELEKVAASRSGRTRAEYRVQQVRKDERELRYQTIMALHSQGMKPAEIGERLGMAARTVRHWLSSRGLPYSGERRQRPRLLDPYIPYLLDRWQQGCRKGSQLEKEIRARGYTGSGRALYRYLLPLKSTAISGVKQAPPLAPVEGSPLQETPLSVPVQLSAPQATWLFFRRKADLKKEEQAGLSLLLQASPKAQTVYHLVESFLHMVRERKGEQLDSWLQAVQESHLQAFVPFVSGIQQDKDAILAGLTLPWSTGPLEGHINRLKLIKRQGYGRASFDLLRRRVLHQPRPTQQGSPPASPLREQQGRKEEGQTFQHITSSISRVA